MTMRSEWLSAFAVFADHLNLTHAARALHVSQPALHAQLRKLAEEVGRPLYRREGRGIVLTEEGRRLAAFARESEDRARVILAELRGDEAPAPRVLASGPGALTYLLGPAIRKLARAERGLRVVPASGPATLSAVRDARAHVGVAVLDARVDDLACTPVAEVGQAVIVPRGHRLARRRRVRARDLEGEPLIAAPLGSPHRTMVTQVLRASRVEARIAVEASGWDLVLQLASYGLGLAIVNDFCRPPAGFVSLPLEGAPAVTYWVVARRSASPDVAQMVDVIARSIPARQSAITSRR